MLDVSDETFFKRILSKKEYKYFHFIKSGGAGVKMSDSEEGMSKSTLEALSELLEVSKRPGGSSRKGGPKPASSDPIEALRREKAAEAAARRRAEEAKPFREPWTRERDRASYEELLRKRREESSTSRTSGPSSSFDSGRCENTRTEIATMSINPAKACIVFRAVMSEEVIAAIDNGIDRKHRYWNERDRVWEFNPVTLKELKAILTIYYQEVQVIGVPKAIPATKFDKLLSRLDKDDRAKIYRLLAGKYHPDIQPSGNNETMVLINEVFKQ